jgi:tryptophan synthase alpha chain
MVSSASVTGSQNAFGKLQDDYFKRIADLNLKSPQIIGFGISNAETFKKATKYSKGAIIGSAFVKYLDENGTENIHKFVSGIID